MDFIYLNNKSGYSFLKSSLKIENLIRYAKDKGMPYLGLTDHNNMMGVLEFISLCKKNNIKPIIGMEVVLEISETPLILIATCNEGYISLCKLTRYVSIGDFEGFVSLEQLAKCNTGLICILPYIRGHMDEMDNKSKIDFYLSLKNIYKNLYIGLEYYTSADISKLNDARNFASSNNINYVPIIDVIAESSSNTELNDILKAIDLNTTINNIETVNYEGHYFINESKIRSIFSEDEIKITKHLAELCDIDLSKIKGDLVKYPLKDDVSDYDYLYSLAHKGLEKRLNNHVPQIYLDRLDYELNIIKKMNFVNYFLVVFDYVKFAKTHDILVGPGRGSGGGCLVAYAIGITQIDPIKYNLLFERFLNPERVSMPDIDVDFIDTKRQQVFDYLINKYGKERTCRVLATSTLTARSCLKQVAKAYGVSEGETKEISKRYFGNNEEEDVEKGITLQKLYDENSSFKSLIKTDERYNKIFKSALQLENIPRQITTHAAGIVISDCDVCQVMPVYSSDGENMYTQYDGHRLDDFNMYKMDILGLTNLSILEECVNRVYETENVKINVYNIDIEDPNLYKTFKEHKYAGIFQFDMNAVKFASNQVNPSNMLEVAAVLALGRPGAMEYVNTFANRKKGRVKITYSHPSLEPILKETYGVMIYQEQIIQILCKMAGFSLGKADLIRRAISNKKTEMIEQYREEFIKGCINKGYSNLDANNVYDKIVKFGDYGFNKSHSVAYAYLGLQLSYFKTYYPSIFYSAIINILGKTNKLEEYYYEMKSNNVRLLSPSINKSFFEFRNEGKNVRFGFSNIKDLKPNIIKIILEERENGYYKSFVDFVKRTSIKGINKDELYILIEAGCFDEFNINRTTLKYNIDTIILYASICYKKIEDQYVFDASVKEPIIRDTKDDITEIILEEENRLSLCLSTNLIENSRSLFKSKGFSKISELYPNQNVYVIGKITNFRKLKTKNNEQMCIVNISDESGILKVLIWPEVFNVFESLIIKNEYIQIKGKVTNKNDELALEASNLKSYKF